MTEVTIEGLTKVYDDARGTETAVDDLSLSIDDGEFVAVVGPSGCGKSTTLRMLAGLETVTDGTIRFDGERVEELTPTARDVAMVFQNYALYPSMTARENVGYGLKHSTDLSKGERRERVTETLEMLDIAEIADHTPDEISGGQKQRVALGRAIVREPRLFLLDEPLSNLDAKLRSEMRHQLQQIHQDLGITTLYVTHDQKEAITMADRVVILRDGSIQQVAEPETLYNEPANRFVGEFIGTPSMNVLDASVDTSGDGSRVVVDDSVLCTLQSDSSSQSLPAEVVAGLRPEHMGLVDEPADDRIPVEVVVPEYQGKTNFIHVDFAGRQLTARTDPEYLPERGETVYMDVDPADLYLFDPETGAALKHRQPASDEAVTSPRN